MPPMRYVLASFVRNLTAGLRLSLFMPVSRLAFRIDVAQLLLLFVFSATIDVAGDWTRVSAHEFSLYGAGTELYTGALLLLASALLALLFRQRALALAVPVIVLASVPLAQVMNYLVPLLNGRSLPFEMGAALAGRVLELWMVAILVRCVAVAFAPPITRVWLGAIFGGLLLAAPIWLTNTVAPNEPWWRDQTRPAALAEGMSAGSEAVLATQTFLLDHVLSELVDERPGATDLYFVGFAPYGREDVFRKDVEAAQHVMDERWNTSGRSVLLINNPQTLLTAPFATITNLRETLNEIGAAIDVEDDIVMVYLASHGSREFHLSADLPPLSLVELTPPGLRQLLDDAGIKWRIVIVSACYSGGFIQPLQDEHTLIVTASRSDRTSFGCGEASDSTFFGEAFFQKGMATANSLKAAFDLAIVRIAERERTEGFSPPSEPQWWIGPAMADKLAGLRKGGSASGVMTRFFAPRRTARSNFVRVRESLTPDGRAATIGCRLQSLRCP